MNEDRTEFTDFRITTIRRPHQARADRRQGLTTAMVDLAIMAALHGENVMIACSTKMRADIIIDVIRWRSTPIIPLLSLPTFPNDHTVLINPGSIQVFCQDEKSKMEGARVSLAVSDNDDTVDVTGIPVGYPFDPRIFK